MTEKTSSTELESSMSERSNSYPNIESPEQLESMIKEIAGTCVDTDVSDLLNDIMGEARQRVAESCQVMPESTPITPRYPMQIKTVSTSVPIVPERVKIGSEWLFDLREQMLKVYYARASWQLVDTTEPFDPSDKDRSFDVDKFLILRYDERKASDDLFKAALRDIIWYSTKDCKDKDYFYFVIDTAAEYALVDGLPDELYLTRLIYILLRFYEQCEDHFGQISGGLKPYSSRRLESAKQVWLAATRALPKREFQVEQNNALAGNIEEPPGQILKSRVKNLENMLKKQSESSKTMNEKKRIQARMEALKNFSWVVNRVIERLVEQTIKYFPDLNRAVNEAVDDFSEEENRICITIKEKVIKEALEAKKSLNATEKQILSKVENISRDDIKEIFIHPDEEKDICGIIKRVMRCVDGLLRAGDNSDEHLRYVRTYSLASFNANPRGNPHWKSEEQWAVYQKNKEEAVKKLLSI